MQYYKLIKCSEKISSHVNYFNIPIDFRRKQSYNIVERIINC